MISLAGIFVFMMPNAYSQDVSLRPYSARYETQETWYRPFPVIPEKQKGWFRPFLVIMESYDDNIYLSNDDEKSDWITTVSPGFIIKPDLATHKLVFDYRADLEFFDKYDGEDTDNHTTNLELDFLLNKLTFEIDNMFHYFSDRSGSEDVTRVPRTQDYVRARTTFDLNKLDLSLSYYYRHEEYRSDDAIGNFKGQALTYDDLDRDEHQGEIETAFKLWPKTSLLLSGDYGTIEHKTGKKSDSDYFDALIGLRGEPTAKCMVEGRVGYRKQDYDDYDDDFDGVIFNGSLIENFSPRDTIRIDFLRRTEDTIYKDNAYYKNTFVGVGYKHGFTDRVFGNINGYYQWNRYPSETIEDAETAKREDDLWSTSAGLNYEFPKGFTVNLIYEYRVRDSNFAKYDYKDNRVSIGLTVSF